LRIRYIDYIGHAGQAPHRRIDYFWLRIYFDCVRHSAHFLVAQLHQLHLPQDLLLHHITRYPRLAITSYHPIFGAASYHPIFADAPLHHYRKYT
jgi:hypothetical protein